MRARDKRKAKRKGTKFDLKMAPPVVSPQKEETYVHRKKKGLELSDFVGINLAQNGLLTYYFGHDDDLEVDGSDDPDQTSSIRSEASGTSLDQKMSVQAQLMQQLNSSDFSSSPEGSAEGSRNGTFEQNGASGGSLSSEQQQASNRAMTSEMTFSTTSISMPGLQPFSKGSKMLPSSWSDCTLSGDAPFCLVMLNKKSWEFQSILKEFTDANLTVKKIERVENRDLWEKFDFEKRRMEKNVTEVNEVYLFHGTLADKEQICHEGLDQRLSRIGYFGRGIYFSNDPRKCVSYTQSDKKETTQPFQLSTCTVYKCRVLLGNMKVYPPGKHAKDLKREPLVENPEPGGPKYYDSVKGHVKEFDEFILYKSERVMPEYVISCFLPSASTSEEPPASLTVTPPESHRDNTPEEDLYGGSNEEDVHAELQMEFLHQQGQVVEKRGNLEENLYAGLDEEEISAELQAGALQQNPRHVAEEMEGEVEMEDEVSLELRAGARSGPPLKEAIGEEESHPEVEEGDVYEQLHQEEILSAIKARERKEQEEIRKFVDEEKRRQDRIRADGRDGTSREDRPGVIVNQLDDKENSEEPGRGRDAPLDQDHQRRLEEVRSLMKKSHPSRPEAPPRRATLPKSAREPAIDPGGTNQTVKHQGDVTVNRLEENGRHKKETIAPEFLPVVLEVREKVQKARLQEKDGGQKDKVTRTKSVPSTARKTPQWAQGGMPSVWTPSEYVEHQKVIAKVREKVQADRKAEELQKQRQGTSKDTGEGATVTDNSLSPNWRDGGNDGVGEVLDVLIVQFMDFTACEDIVEAREYILKANMDVNQAIVSYIGR